MRNNRYFWFVLSILIGIIAGSAYGWFISPAELKETTLDTLRTDYQVDYALMVAEIFQEEQDVNLALSRLSYLGDEDSADILREILDYARDMGYSPEDRALLATLSRNLMLEEPIQEGGEQ